MTDVAPAERLADLLERLDRERAEADRLYNEALTALDGALLAEVPALPHPPPGYDESKLSELNAAWNILPAGAPAADSSLKGRLRAFVWRLVGPPLEGQRAFNAALIDHLNRNADAHRESAKAIASAIAMQQQQFEALVRFEHHLIRLLQTITLYVDTRDRAAGADARVVNAGLSTLTDDWLKRWESLRLREVRLVERLGTIDLAIADVRATAALGQLTALTVKREVEHHLVAAVPVVPAVPAVPVVLGSPLDAYKYLGFEDAFRGSQDEIRRRLATYVPKFAGQTDVLDIGCGRGEFLELLGGAGIRARGLDLNHEMVEQSRRRGLDVAEGDALSYLRGLPDASLGGLFAAQVVEHLDPDYLASLLETAGHKLRPGAVIILETINPACWLAFFESYIRDLTHVRPLHPETLQYLLRVSGFTDVTIDYLSPVAEDVRLQVVGRPPDSAPPHVIDFFDTFNDNVRKLNARMFTYQDYAAVGRRP